MEEHVPLSETAAARDQAAAAGWAERQLTPPERERLRSHYAARKGPDLAYLGQAAGFVVAFTAICYFVLRAPAGLPRGPLPALAFAVVGLLIAIFYNPKRLRRAFRLRRAHVPTRVWVWPVEVTRWRGKDRQGEIVHEVRCCIDGQMKAVEIPSEQWERFPEGAAEVEILPGGRRRVYRFRFAEETVQVYPDVRRLAGGAPEPVAITTGAARPAPAPRPSLAARRRKRHHNAGRGRPGLRARKKDLLWLGVVVIVGTALTVVVLESENRTISPDRATAAH